MPKKLLVLIAGLLLVACSDSTVYSEFQQTGSKGWNQEQVMEFSFPAPDTLSKHDLFLYVRNDDQYPYRNLFLITTINFPTGQVIKDTLEYEMAHPDGRWMGEGLGSLRENKLWYKEAITFPSAGDYTVEVQHAIRKNGQVDGDQVVPGITDVGLEVVKRD